MPGTPELRVADPHCIGEAATINRQMVGWGALPFNFSCNSLSCVADAHAPMSIEKLA